MNSEIWSKMWRLPIKLRMLSRTSWFPQEIGMLCRLERANICTQERLRIMRSNEPAAPRGQYVEEIWEGTSPWSSQTSDFYQHKWWFPKIGVPPNHPLNIFGFFIINQPFWIPPMRISKKKPYNILGILAWAWTQTPCDGATRWWRIGPWRQPLRCRIWRVLEDVGKSLKFTG